MDRAIQTLDEAMQPWDEENPTLVEATPTSSQTSDGETFTNDVFRRFLNNITITRYIPGPQVTSPSGPFGIPQRPYCQGSAIPAGAVPQIIFFVMANGDYCPAELALAGNCDLLEDRNGAALSDHVQTINMRIEWPGYDGWGAQIRTVDYRSPPRSIPRAKLVTEIAKHLERFIENKQGTAIDPAYARYRVGQGGIELRNIRIASLEQASRGSWQPRFICNGS